MNISIESYFQNHDIPNNVYGFGHGSDHGTEDGFGISYGNVYGFGNGSGKGFVSGEGYGRGDGNRGE